MHSDNASDDASSGMAIPINPSKIHGQSVYGGLKHYAPGKPKKTKIDKKKI